MRDWLAAAEAAGEVREVRGADWRLEIGALCELDYRLPHPWALLFDDIVGYPRGRGLLTGAAAGWGASPRRRRVGAGAGPPPPDGPRLEDGGARPGASRAISGVGGPRG